MDDMLGSADGMIDGVAGLLHMIGHSIGCATHNLGHSTDDMLGSAYGLVGGSVGILHLLGHFFGQTVDGLGGVFRQFSHLADDDMDGLFDDSVACVDQWGGHRDLYDD